MKTADLQAWLASVGIEPNTGAEGAAANGTWSFDGYLPPTPARLVVLTASGGTSTYLEEREFDIVACQVFTRGLENQPADAEALAWQVDDAVLDAVPPFPVGGKHCIATDRVGGPPRFYQRDTARRTLFVCNYLFTVARS